VLVLWPQVTTLNYSNPVLEINQRITDAYVGMFVTAWFWPYFVIGNLESWQKLGITMNGLKPICSNQGLKNNKNPAPVLAKDSAINTQPLLLP